MDDTIPSLADDPAYADDPVHAEPEDDGTLTPLQELGVEHVFGTAPFIIEATVWGMPVRYRVLDERELLLCDDGAIESPSESGRIRAKGIHYLTRSIVDIDGNAPLAPDQADTLPARFAYIWGLKGAVVQALLEQFLAVHVLFRSLLDGDSIPKSSSAPAGAGNSYSGSPQE